MWVGGRLLRCPLGSVDEELCRGPCKQHDSPPPHDNLLCRLYAQGNPPDSEEAMVWLTRACSQLMDCLGLGEGSRQPPRAVDATQLPLLMTFDQCLSLLAQVRQGACPPCPHGPHAALLHNGVGMPFLHRLSCRCAGAGEPCGCVSALGWGGHKAGPGSCNQALPPVRPLRLPGRPVAIGISRAHGAVRLTYTPGQFNLFRYAAHFILDTSCHAVCLVPIKSVCILHLLYNGCFTVAVQFNKIQQQGSQRWQRDQLPPS